MYLIIFLLRSGMVRGKYRLPFPDGKIWVSEKWESLWDLRGHLEQLPQLPFLRQRHPSKDDNCWWLHPLVGEGSGSPLQCSCLENPIDGGAWWAAVHGVAKNQTWLSNFTFTSHVHALEKEMENHFSVLAWRVPGMGGLVGCCLWGRTESDTTEATSQQQQQHPLVLLILQWKHEKWNKIYSCIGICANEGRKTCAWKMRSANVFLASD